MSNISISDVMASRNAILERNAALRNVTSNPVSVAQSGATFEAAMKAALVKANGPGSLSAAGATQSVSETGRTDPSGFATTLQTQLQKINAINARAGKLTVAYERGEETDIAKVMLARQESGIAFEATLQIRNKVLSAYKDIMSMPV